MPDGLSAVSPPTNLHEARRAVAIARLDMRLAEERLRHAVAMMTLFEQDTKPATQDARNVLQNIVQRRFGAGSMDRILTYTTEERSPQQWFARLVVRLDGIAESRDAEMDDEGSRVTFECTRTHTRKSDAIAEVAALAVEFATRCDWA